MNVDIYRPKTISISIVLIIMKKNVFTNKVFIVICYDNL